LPPTLSRPQQRGLLLLGAVILSALFFFHWFPVHPPASPNQPAVSSGGRVLIELSGDVQRPGLYAYERPPTVDRVLRDGGGLCGGGKLAPGPAGEVLHRETRLVLSAAAPKVPALEKGPLSVRALWVLGRPIPLNRATAEELDAIPGIGPGLARRIVEHRETRGPFAEPGELQQVPGIGEKTLEKLRPFLTIP
jgi:competence protein ComEA